MTLLPLLLAVSAAALLPSAAADGEGAAGALGALRVEPLQQLLPLRFWANPRRAALRPRRRDLREDALLGLLGDDFQPAWMRVRKARAGRGEPSWAGVERGSVRALRALADAELAALEDAGLPAEARAPLRAWLLHRATCPVRFAWADLGPYFWPRWLRRGECGHAAHPADLPDEDNLTTAVLREGEDDDEDEDGGEARRPLNATQSCSWPPGMQCVPGRARPLHILRWHCRLRKLSQDASFNAIWSAPSEKSLAKLGARQKRSKYRCAWIKVPYSVAEDCVCAVGSA